MNLKQSNIYRGGLVEIVKNPWQLYQYDEFCNSVAVQYLACLSALVSHVNHYPSQNSWKRWYKRSLLKIEKYQWYHMMRNHGQEIAKGYHFLHISGALRRVPSPLQGTSHRTRSKVSWVLWGFTSLPAAEALKKLVCARHPGKCCASWFVTMRLAVHILLVWCMRRLHLWTSKSFATT